MTPMTPAMPSTADTVGDLPHALCSSCCSSPGPKGASLHQFSSISGCSHHTAQAGPQNKQPWVVPLWLHPPEAPQAPSGCPVPPQLPRRPSRLREHQGVTQTPAAPQGTPGGLNHFPDIHLFLFPTAIFSLSPQSTVPAALSAAGRPRQPHAWRPSRSPSRRWRRSGRAPMAWCTRLATSARGSWWPSRRSAWTREWGKAPGLPWRRA